MEKEEKSVKLQIDKTKIINEKLILCEDLPEDSGMVVLELEVNDKKYSCSHDNFFSALIELRKQLEVVNIQIMCSGAAKNVYPSPMQFSMGNTRKAYKTYLGKQAKMTDMVDIFDYDEDLEFVSVDEQSQFNNLWIDSF